MSKEKLEDLAKNGTCCFVIKGDSADLIAMNRMINWVHEHLPPITQMVHAAGVLGHNTIMDMDEIQFWHVARPKVQYVFVMISDDLKFMYYVF